MRPIDWVVLFAWSAIGILWIGAELVSAQSNVTCGSQPSEAHCFGYHDRCHWDDGDIEQPARCTDGSYCSYLTNETACATDASAFRCRWDTAGGWCGARVLPSLQACSQVGLAFRGGDLFAAGLEMGYERRILFASDADRVRSAASTRTLVDAAHACFDAAAAFERDINDTMSNWEDGLVSLLPNASLADWHPAPGIYEVTANMLSLSGTLTLDAGGDPYAFWVFRVSGTLRLDNVAVQLVGGARQGQVTWILSHDLPLDVVDAAVPSPTSTPTRLVGTFLFLADNATVRLDGPQPVVSGAFLSLGTRASFLLGSGGVVFGDTPDACAYYGRNATRCLDKDRSWMSCMLAPVTGLCTNLDCPATFAKTGLCPTNRCRLSANNKFCADSLPCSRAMTHGACTQLDPLRCDWMEEEEGEGVCVQRALPPFPSACEGFGAIFNGTDRRRYVAGGVTATGSDGSSTKRGQLVAFAPPVGDDTGNTDVQYDPAHACFPAMAAYHGVIADTSAWPIRTSTGPSSPDAEWLLVPGVHRRIVSEVAPRTAVVFDAQSDPDAFWVVDVRKLTLAATTRVHMRNGAEARNIVWLTSEGGADLFAPFVPGTVIDTSARGIQIGGGGGDSDAPPTVDGRVVALHPDASLVLPGAVLGLDGSCYAHDESAEACRASPRRCTFAATRDASSSACLPTPCFADALSADSCPLDRCRLVPFGTIRGVCASGLQCSFAQTAEQCETQYGTWKDCHWTDGVCVEALRSLPIVSECGPYSVVVGVTGVATSVARIRGLDLGERAMATDVRPADFDTITPAQLVGQTIIDTARCTMQMHSQLGSLSVITTRIPQRPTPASWGAGVVLRRGTYVIDGDGYRTVDGQIVFDAEGDSNAYWVIYATSAVSFGAQMQMRLVNRAQQRNIFWVGAVDSMAGWYTTDGSVLGMTSPLLGTFMQMPGASSWVQFRGRKIAGRVLSAMPSVDLSGSSFVDSCYMIADRVGCAASVTPLCSFDEFSGTCAPAPCGDPRWTGATTATSCPTNRCRRAGDADAGGEGGRTCIDGADCAVFRTAAGCQSPSAPRCKWSAATGVCSKKRLDTALAACEAIGVAFQGTNEDDFRMNGVYMGNNRSIVATTLRFGAARTLRSYLRDPAHPCFGALGRLAADVQDRAAWPTSVGIDTSAPHIAVTLKPGVYDYARLPFFLTSLTFDAGFDPDAYWILRVPSLMFAETLAIALVNRAQMRNIVWVGVTEGATWSLNAPFIPGIFVHPKAGATVTMQSRIKMGMLATLGATSKLSIQHSIFVDSSDELLPPAPEVRVVSVAASKTSLEEAMMVIGPIAIAMVGVGVFGYLAIVLWKARAAKAAAQASAAAAVTRGRATRLKALQRKEQRQQQQQAQSPPMRDLYRIALL